MVCVVRISCGSFYNSGVHIPFFKFAAKAVSNSVLIVFLAVARLNCNMFVVWVCCGGVAGGGVVCVVWWFRLCLRCCWCCCCCC